MHWNNFFDILIRSQKHSQIIYLVYFDNKTKSTHVDVYREWNVSV